MNASVPINSSIPAYGETADRLLGPLQRLVDEFSGELVEKFYRACESDENMSRIIAALHPEEFIKLRIKQDQHVKLLLSSGLSEIEHKTGARHAGRAHALVGVEISWLIELYSLYQVQISDFIINNVDAVEDRLYLIQIMFKRINVDLENQVKSYKELSYEIGQAFKKINNHALATTNLAELIRGSLEIICGLPGNVSGFFARADDTGELQVEQSAGHAATKYHQAMEEGIAQKLSADPDIDAGQGPGGRAWRTGEIIATDAWLIEGDLKPWKKIGKRLGFRSSCAVPLLDASGRTIALLSLYSTWHCFFSSYRVRDFLTHVQRVLGQAVAMCGDATVTPMRSQRKYRDLLNNNRVVMLYQPVIDLHDGDLNRYEALARLRSDPEGLVSPAQFLPAFGKAELFKLFAKGVEVVCRDYRNTLARDSDTAISINLPPEGLDDPRYEDVLFETIEKNNLKPSLFDIEILESGESLEESLRHQDFIERLKSAGIKIVQDDLGSGHSSLIRLQRYAFDEVKIDQGLVRGAINDPERAVGFILYLTRLAHTLRIPVTVEGIETIGLLEAAEILGADFGQGYNIARPMPAEETSEWRDNYNFPIERQSPRTGLGAIAGYILWDLQIASISDRPDLIEEFEGAKSMVQNFIDTNRLQGSRIDDLLSKIYKNRNGKLVEGRDQRFYRDDLIKELSRFDENIGH